MKITNKISKFFLQIYFTNCEEIYESFGDFYFFQEIIKNDSYDVSSFKLQQQMI
jgi:hypothetical protein